MTLPDDNDSTIDTLADLYVARILSKVNFLVSPQRTSSDNCQETETRMVRECQAPRQLLQNHPSGYLGGRRAPWSAEEMLDGQRQRVDVPAYARIDPHVTRRERLEEDLC